MSQLSLSGPCIILWCCLSSTGLYCLPVYLTTPKSTSQPPQSILQTPQSTSQLPVHLTTPPVYPTTPSPPYNPPVHLTTRQSTSQPPVYLTTPSPPHNPQSTPQPPVYLTTPQSTSQTQSTSQPPVYLTTHQSNSQPPSLPHNPPVGLTHSPQSTSQLFLIKETIISYLFYVAFFLQLSAKLVGSQYSIFQLFVNAHGGRQEDLICCLKRQCRGCGCKILLTIYH